jgi:hypothetical protein
VTSGPAPLQLELDGQNQDSDGEVVAEVLPGALRLAV